VIFMAGAMLTELRAALLGAGLAPGTPAALLESGTLAHARVVRGSVADLPELGASRGAGPVLVVVGRTVALAEKLRPGAQGVTAKPAAANGGDARGGESRTARRIRASRTDVVRFESERRKATDQERAAAERTRRRETSRR
jgi:hypothetical protein